MKSKTISLVFGFILMFSARFVAAQSLADMARAEKAKQNKDEKKPAKVYTNEDVHETKSEPGRKAHSTPNSPTSSSTITAQTKDGSNVQVAPDKGTDLIFMGSWCPHSTALKNMLNDSRMRSYWANRKLIFLYSNDEWSEKVKPHLEKEAKSADVPESEVTAELDRLKRKAGSPYVTYPAALDNLPGDSYFCAIPDQVDGFPTALSVRGYDDRYVWMSEVLKMPDELVTKLKNQYEPD